MAIEEFVLTPTFWVLIGVLVIWSMILKGYGLWKAGNKKDKPWFIAMFLLNTAGILPLIYIYLNRNRPKKSIKKPRKRKK